MNHMEIILSWTRSSSKVKLRCRTEARGPYDPYIHFFKNQESHALCHINFTDYLHADNLRKIMVRFCSSF